MARFETGQNKKEDLSVKESGSDGVATGKTVARPIHKWARNEGPLPVHKNLYPLVRAVYRR